MLFNNFGVNCETYWKSIILIFSVLAIVSPMMYFKCLEKYRKPTQSNLLLFNIVEYISLQIGISPFFTTSNSICFGQSDGGLIFVFTAWLSLPILIGLSLIFKKKLPS